jgi:apolipoprotein N-acyltransferase
VRREGHWTGEVVRFGAFALLGASIAQIAWDSPDLPEGARLSVLMALPFAWGAVDRRGQVLVLFASYQAWAVRRLPFWLSALPMGRSWGGPVVVWLTLALLAAVPWACLLPKPGEPAVSRGGRCATSLVSVSLPPLGWMCPLDPLGACAGLFPAAGWYGLLGGTVFAAILAASARRCPLAAIGAFSASILWAACWPASEAGLPSTWMAVSTTLGRLQGHFPAWHERHLRLLSVVHAALDRGATLVLLPEAVAGPWGPAADVWWREVSERARARGAIVLIGAEVARQGRTLNALRAVGTTEGMVAAARLVAPLYWWKPWRRDGIQPAPPGTARTLDHEGRRIGFSFCVEDLSPAAVLGLFVGPGAPDVLASVANHGWMPPGESARIQAASVRVWARLFGVPLLRADNDPGVSRP